MSTRKYRYDGDAIAVKYDSERALINIFKLEHLLVANRELIATNKSLTGKLSQLQRENIRLRGLARSKTKESM